MNEELMTISEVLDFQMKTVGRRVIGRDTLYAIARSCGDIPVVRMRSRVFFPKSTVVALLTGKIAIPRDL